MKLIDLKVKEFVDVLASDAPAPGGGSVAALVGSLGAALCAMVMNLTKGDKFADVQSEVEAYKKEAAELQNFFVTAIDADTDAFTKIMVAFKMPKATDEEKKIRTGAIQEATKGATLLPLSVAEHCLPVMKLAQKVLTVGNPNAASDAKVAIVCAHAAFYSAVYNVEINVGSIKDGAFAAEVTDKVAIMKADLAALQLKF